MDRKAIGSWLSGPGAVAGDMGAVQRYRGERLGLPEGGTNAIAPVGRRLLALLADWLLSYLIATGIFRLHYGTAQGQLGVLAVFAAEYLLLLSTLGYTIGMRLLGIRVARLGGPLTPLAVIVRTVLLCLVIPAVVWDRDTRALHDRISQTAVVNR